MVICDAGGCAGNVCGFDEPRWFTKRAQFSARGFVIWTQFDVTTGSSKASKACEQISPAFTAIIGTPVPSVIATDMESAGNEWQRRKQDFLA